MKKNSNTADVYTPMGCLVCIPTYNEVCNIFQIVPSVLRVLPGAHILIVDDNSPDGTGAAAEQLSKEDQRVHVLHRRKKEGLGNAYQDAFRWALTKEYQFVIEFDADFSHDPSYLVEMASQLKRGRHRKLGNTPAAGVSYG